MNRFYKSLEESLSKVYNELDEYLIEKESTDSQNFNAGSDTFDLIISSLISMLKKNNPSFDEVKFKTNIYK